jgi:hypothetical protein
MKKGNYERIPMWDERWYHEKSPFDRWCDDEISLEEMARLENGYDIDDDDDNGGCLGAIIMFVVATFGAGAGIFYCF